MTVWYYLAPLFTSHRRRPQVSLMYTSFAIENFRLFKNLTIGPLARVNLIAGKNNAGKTSLLEALWLHSGPSLPDMGVRVASFRGIRNPDPRRLLYDLFHDFDPKHTIVLSAAGDWDGNARMLKVKSQPRSIVTASVPNPNFIGSPPRGSQEADVSSVSSTEIVLHYQDESGHEYISTGWLYRSARQVGIGPNFQMTMGSEGMAAEQAEIPGLPSSVFISARQRTEPEDDVERFGEVELENYSGHIVDCLNSIDRRIKGLRTIATDAPPMIYADVGLSRPVPMGFLGDGLVRLLSMALAFYQARDGALLVDEIENGLHYSILRDVWKNLNRLSREFNVQVFATTHSRECMVAARDAFKEMEDDDLRIHRISRRPDGMRATTYPFDALDFTLDYGAEMR